MLATFPPDLRERIKAGVAREVIARLNAHRAKPAYQFYGRNLEFYNARNSITVLAGAAETGKSLVALALLDHLARTNPGFQGAIVRKIRADMDGSILQTYRDEILGKHTDVQVYGGAKAEWFDYPRNDSRIWVGGMDRPSKVLSSQRDAVLISQAEELDRPDLETISTRTTGRAGHLFRADGTAYGMVLAECNPASPTHFIWSMHLAGLLTLIESRHVDNPRLYNQVTGDITPQGAVTIDRLKNLTGYRRARLYEGRWVQAEGIVYDQWLESENVTDEAEFVPGAGPVFMACDDGYSAGSAPDTRGRDPHTGQYVSDAHPRVIMLCQEKADGRLDFFYESTACLKLSDQHLQEVIAEIKANRWDMPQYAVHGPGQAEIRGRLQQAGIAPRQCMARVDESIKELQSWIGKDTNGWRRLHVNPRCKNIRAEMVSYQYEPGTDKPMKAWDHSNDAARAITWTLRHNR